jgi:hypothetical protein
MPADVRDDTPLRLEIAARLAFPDGTMTVSGLRREAARGRLAIERVANKDYTTLAAIREMRELCRAHPKAPACGSPLQNVTRPAESPRPPIGASGMDELSIARAAVMMTVQKLKGSSPTTSRPSTTRQRRADATRLP